MRYWTRGMLVIALLSTAAARAVITDCNPPEPAPFVVNLNELDDDGQIFRSQEQRSVFFQRLWEHLDQKRDAQMAGIVSVPFRVAHCKGRKPKLDGSEFTKDLVKSLLSNQVVIEVWGRLGTRQVGNRKEPTAKMYYLILPVRKASNDRSTQAPSLHRFDYPDRDIKSDEHVGLISNLDLYAFIVAAIGLRAFENEEFAQAHEFLCKSNATLGAIKIRLAQSSGTQAQRVDIESLRAYVVDLAGKSQKAVDKRVAPSVRLQNPNDPCSDLGGRP